MNTSVEQLRYLAYIKEAEDFENLANEATTLFVKEAMLEAAADYRRLAEEQLGTSEPEGEQQGPREEAGKRPSIRT